jgi:hypothetical protein
MWHLTARIAGAGSDSWHPELGEAETALAAVMGGGQHLRPMRTPWPDTHGGRVFYGAEQIGTYSIVLFPDRADRAPVIREHYIAVVSP